jgi:putative tryptophan/tyrosine transport system substrate-binding protein
MELASMLWRDAEEAAHSLALEVFPVEARSGQEIEAAFLRATRDSVRGIVIAGSGTFWVERDRIARLALHNRLPSMSSLRLSVQAGILMSYGVNDTEMFRSAGRLVGKVLKGAKPEHLPVEAPTKFEFVLNLKTARALGLTIPPSVLLRADQVLE